MLWLKGPERGAHRADPPGAQRSAMNAARLRQARGQAPLSAVSW
jgi:hypothetical protein